VKASPTSGRRPKRRAWRVSRPACNLRVEPAPPARGMSAHDAVAHGAKRQRSRAEREQKERRAGHRSVIRAGLRSTASAAW
jgi:hypothetical protein